MVNFSSKLSSFSKNPPKISVRIYKPCQSVMQSGRAKTRQWVMEFDSVQKDFIGQLMGWVGSCDTNQEIKLKFSTFDEAITFAKRHNFAYKALVHHAGVASARSYSDNFRHDIRR